MSISPTSKQTAADFASTLKQLNDEANQTASIGADDSRFKTLSDDLDQMISQAPDDNTKRALQSMKSDLANLQALAGSTDQHTDVTNSSWQMLTKSIDDLAAEAFGTTDPLSIGQIADSNKYLNGVQGGGVGAAYKYLSDDQAKAAGLPDAVAQAQKTQQVNKIADAKPPVYVTSSNTTPITYDVYDTSGNKLNDKPLQNFALGLNNGNWLKINDGGIGRSVSITSDQLKTLPSNTELYDLNGMTNNKLVDRGANVGGAPKTPLATGAILTNSPDLPGDLKNNNNQVEVLGTTPAKYMMYDGTQYKVYDENGKPTTTTIASGEKNPSGSVPFALGLGNGTWFTSSGKGFTGNDIVSDVTKSPIYNNDLQTFAFGADGKAHNWDKPAS